MSNVSNAGQSRPASALTDFSADAPGPSVSIDSLLLYCSSRLNALGSNVDQYYAEQLKTSHDMEEIADVMEFVRTQGKQDGVNALNICQNGVFPAAVDRANAILEKYRSVTSSGAKEALAKEFQLAAGYDIREVSGPKVDEVRMTKEATLGHIPATDDAAVSGRLEDIKGQQSALSRNAEMNMIGLQALVSQRQLAIQLTTQMLQTMHESSKGVLGNIR